MKLSELLRGMSDVRIVGSAKDREITRVTDDSRTVADDSVIFFVRRGHTSDGAMFVPDAIRRGCRVFLSERGLSLPPDCTQILCKFGLKASAEIAMRCFDHPEKQLFFVGITGTKGKTTTAFFLTHLLRFAGERVASVGTLGVDLGGEIRKTENTTPSLFVLLPIFSEFVRRGIRTVVMEVSSQALADGRVFGIPFSLGIFTSFFPDHIGTTEHRDLAEYTAAKRSLFSSYHMNTVIVNDDDAAAAYMVSDVPRKIFCSTGHPADVRAYCLFADRRGTRFSVDDATGEIALIGKCHLMNALLALAAANRLTGEAIGDLLPALKGLGVPGRFERVEHGGRVFIIDYAHNGESVRKIAQTVRELYDGRRVAVFGSVGGRGEMRRYLLSRAAEACMDFSVITSDDPGTEDALGICAELYAHFSDKTRAKIIVDRAEAIRYAYRISKPGDVILLLGKGHEIYQKTIKGNLPFSEKNILASLDNPARV